MNDKINMEGGCLCGDIRYRIKGTPFDADHCHCRICQKMTGAVMASWMDFKVEQLTWVSGNPAEYESSKHVRRGFCSKCGTSLSFRDIRHPDYFTLTIASLDNPNQVKPNYHIHTDSQVEWLTIVDDCKRYGLNRGD
jgi:hypothetical protein